jgi:hypothetical protein
MKRPPRLRDRNLAFCCRLDRPWHADMLLETTTTPAETLRHAGQVEEQADYQAARDRSNARAAAIAELRRVAARLRQDYGRAAG